MSIAAKNKIGLATSLRLNWKHLGSNQNFPLKRGTLNHSSSAS